MKLRMLFLAVAVVAFSSVSFGQGGSFRFIWASGTSNGWTPLTYCDDAGSPTLEDGTVVRLYKESFAGDFFGWDATDPLLVVGANGLAGEVSMNEFVFNSADIPRPLGSFQSPIIEYTGATPAGGQHIYLVAGCYDESEVFHPMYSTGGAYNPGQGYTEIIIHDPSSGHSWPPTGGAGWVRRGCCEPPTSCEGTASPFEILTGPAGTHGLIPDPDQPQSYCVYLCPGFDLEVVIGQAWYDETPVLYITPGCDPSDTECDLVCPPANFTVVPGGWLPYEPDGIDGYWTYVIQVETEGCACLYLEDILPAEMGTIDIAARDNAVELSWNTLSESNLSHFVIARDGVVRAEINANNSPSGANYTYTDEARNGVTYSYTLSVVDINGGVRELATSSVTPSINAVGTITEYSLHQNFPNPFNPTTNIIFDVVNENHVELTVYNAMGQTVATLVNGTFGNGRHSVEFSSESLTSGLYFYTVKVGNEFTATKKMLLVK